jgi:eukaryotic-like serine/threonine-protein kinase
MTVLHDPLIGRVIQDTWKVEEFVARGSMGAVYRAVHTKIGTSVAVKVLNPEFLHDEEIRERFRREATVSSRCDSAHLVRVLDFSTESDGYVALIMEWLHGETLAAFLKRRGALRVGEVVTLVTQVGEGLSEAHAAGIIHRDLKPGNIYLAESGHGGLVVPKILDFGISKIVEEGGDLTGTATMMGTPHYMPVEQFDSSRDVDRRADIYALGVICYELLAGRRPFAGASPVQILNKITSQDPPPLPDSVPAPVAAVVKKAMSRHAGDRYSQVEDFVEAFTDAAEGVGLGPGSSSSTTGVFEVDGNLQVKKPPLTLGQRWQRYRWVQRLQRWPRWRIPVVGGVALVAVVLSVGLTVALCGRAGERVKIDHVKPSSPPRAKPWRLLRTLFPVHGAARDLALDGAGRLVAGVSASGEVRVWRLADGKVLTTFGRRARAVALASDGGLLAVGDEAGRIYLQPMTGSADRTLEAHARPVRALAFSGDGNRLLSGDSSGQARVWDLVSGRSVATFGGTSPVVDVALSGDGGLAVIGHADGRVSCWDVNGQTLRVRLTAHVGGVAGLALHPAGVLMVSAGADGVARVWRLPGSAPVRVLRGHRGVVRAVALSEDGQRVLTGGADQTVRLWDVRTGGSLGEQRLPSPASGLALARSGRLRLVSGPTLGVRVFGASR